MSNYVKSTDFASKDDLATGNPLKLIKGTEINTEFNNIQTAVATKADLSSPAFTGNPTATTQATDNNTSRLATTAFVQNQIAADSTFVDITGGTIAGVAITGGSVSGLATDLAVADGGTGASTFTVNSVVLGNGTNSLAGNMVAPGTSGNALVSNGTSWVSGQPQVSNASFTGSNQSLAVPGYQKLPGGLIIQWGTGSSSSTVTFPIAFPTAVLSLVATLSSGMAEISLGNVTLSNFYMYTNQNAFQAKYIAIGY